MRLYPLPRAVSLAADEHEHIGNVSHRLSPLGLSRSEDTAAPAISLSGAALAIGLFWAIGAANFRHPQPQIFLHFLVGLALGAALLTDRRHAAWGVLGYAVAIGVAERFARVAVNGSDVIGTTTEAIGLVTRGMNPYVHTYHFSNPPGSPFPYLPGEIAWYGLMQRITGQVVGTDKWAGIRIVLLLAALAVHVGPERAAFGTILYATFEPAVLRSLDGSNDTSLAFLILLAIALLMVGLRLRWSVLFYASAVVFGWALIFKAFAWLIYPFVVNHLRRRGSPWRRYAAVSLGLALLVSAPFLTAPAGFVHNLLGALSFHTRPFGLDIWAALTPVGPARVGIAVAPELVVAAGIVLSAVLIRSPAGDLGRALFQGCAVVFAALLLARYATSSYYTFLCAVLAAGLILWRSPDAATALLPSPGGEANGAVTRMVDRTDTGPPGVRDSRLEKALHKSDLRSRCPVNSQ